MVIAYTKAGSDSLTTGGTGAGGSNVTADRIYHVSSAGNDTNNGLAWSSAFLTVGHALTVLGSNAGTIQIGAGTYSASNISLIGGQRLVGAGRYATTIQLAASGTLINQVNQSNGQVENLALAFASTSVTGTLLVLNNSFQHMFFDVKFTGTSTTGQVGVVLNNNAGDTHFLRCKFVSLDVAVQNDTTVNYWDDCVFSTNLTSCMQGGDPTGAVRGSGAVVMNSTFLGATGSPYYINITGGADTWMVSNCWFDGKATVAAVSVGAAGATSASQGPRLFSFRDIPFVCGGTGSTSVIINAGDRIELDGVNFGNTGANPTDLSFPTPTVAKRGRLGAYKSAQSTKIETVIPASWDGYAGYADSADNTIQLLETTTYRNGVTPHTHRRIVIRVQGRTTGSAAVTITFPSAFETLAFATTFDNSGLSPTVTQSTIAFPTGIAADNKIIVLEGV